MASRWPRTYLRQGAGAAMLYPLLGFKDHSFPAGLGWHFRVEEGVPRLALWGLARALKVHVSELADLVGVPLTDLVWAKRKEFLPRDVSGQLYQIALALHRLYAVLPSPTIAAAWLKAPRKELGGDVPIRLLLTQPGADAVFAVIARIIVVPAVAREVRQEPVEDAEADTDSDAGVPEL